MFDIYLFTFAKKENSTKQPSLTGQTPFQCDIKSPSSLINPLIELHSNTNPVAYNYAYIPEFRRYFFVSDWRYDRGLWFANLSVDVLATYKPYIGDTNMYIVRSSAESNPYLYDASYPITNDVDDTGHYQSWNISGNVSFPDGGYFYLTVLSSSGTGSTCYKFAPSDFVHFIGQLFAQYDVTSLWGTTEDAFKNFIYNPINFIYCCYWFPFNVAGTSVTSIRLGGLDIALTAQRISTGVITDSHSFSLAQHPQASSYGYYLNYPPFTRRVFRSKVFGRKEYVPLDMDASMTLTVYAQTDVRTGLTRIYSSDNKLNITVPTGVNIPVTQNSNDIFSKFMNMITDFNTGLFEMAGGNPFGAFKTFDVFYDKASMEQMNTTTTGSVGGLLDYPLLVEFDEDYYLVADSDNTNKGKPLCKTRKPSNLGGYMVAEKCVLDCPATDIELASLRRYVETGFYYE